MTNEPTNRPDPVHRCHKCRAILWPVLSKSGKAVLMNCSCGLAARVKKRTFREQTEAARWAYRREVLW